MCGIAGYTTKQKTDYRHAVATAVLAIHMEKRGGHAWGVMTDTDVQHGLGSIATGLAVYARQASSFALHTRYGTTGGNTLENAHPFTRHGSNGKVVGVHNGIISNHADLNKKYERTCSVDSQHIFQHIADGTSLDDLAGYGAIVYSLNGDWYVGRFNDGDLHIARTDAGIFFASTREAIIEATSFANIRIVEWLKVKNNSVYRLTSNGIKKAYRINATGTRFKWNDALTSASRQLTRVSSVDVELEDYRWPDFPARAVQSTSASGRVYQCDLCGEYSDDCYDVVYSQGRIDCYCEGCYIEVSDTRSTYQLAERQ
jgi:asparagine synthetase B (glutamine-hydrolysing)